LIFIIYIQVSAAMTDVQRGARRSKGITGTMHKVIKQAKRENYENEVIHNLMAQLNGRTAVKLQRPTTVNKVAKQSQTRAINEKQLLKV
jgi:hypothetical protein